MSQGIHTLPRRLTALFVTALLAAAASILLIASPAAAHDRLLGSDPAAGATVEQLPDVMTLTFSAAIATDAGASEILVTDAAGTPLADGAPTVDGPILSQALTDVTVPGDVKVLWKVVSSDGHPISGEYAFTVATAPEPEPEPTATETPTETPEATTAPEEPVETATPAPTDAENSGDSSAAVPWIVVGVLAVLVIAATTYLIVSRSRRRKAGPTPPATESDDPTER